MASKGHHTSGDFELELREIRGHLVAMGARCERAVQVAIAAFLERDPSKVSEVAQLDERVNADEMELDEMAVRVLALRQPVAYDLRFVTSTLKFVTDLERIADEAVNIAERVDVLVKAQQPPPSSHWHRSRARAPTTTPAAAAHPPEAAAVRKARRRKRRSPSKGATPWCSSVSDGPKSS